MKRRLLAVLGTLCLCGCASVVTPEMTGGSRADGTVELSYDYGADVKPQFDSAKALEVADKSCRAWGYSGAQPMGGQKNECTQSSWMGCVFYRATVPYQCVTHTK